jgi:predicted nucleic acid-binding protein
MIVDASVILRAFFPDEAQVKAQALVRDHVAGRVQLKAPALLPYELGNAVLKAERRGRISSEQSAQIIDALRGLNIEIFPLEWGEMLPQARRFQCSAYDAAYLVLAERLSEPLVTGAERLYNAVQSHLDWVQWISDYPAQPD